MSNRLHEALRLIGDRFPGRLSFARPFDLTLTKRPANREEVIMTKNEFDFSEVSDETKSALALSHEAIKSQYDSLPEQVVTFYKSAAEQLDLDVEVKKAKKADDDDEEEDEKGKKKKKKDDDDEDDKEKEDADMTKSIELVKSALPGVVEAASKTAVAAAVKPLEVEIKKSEDRITELEDRLTRDVMVETATTLMPNGSKPSDELVNQLITIRKSMSDGDWDKYLERQRSQVVLVEKSILFERQQNPQASAPESAQAELEQIAKTIIEKSEDKDPSKAFDIAIQQNPALYKRYREEQSNQTAAAVS